MDFEQDNVLAFLGIVSTKEDFRPAVSVNAPFFLLTPELREATLDKWIEILTNCKEEDLIQSLSEDVSIGEMAVLVHEEPVEKRDIPDNVVIFPGPTNDWGL